MSNQVTYRPRGNLVWGCVAIFLDGLFLTQAIFYPAKGDNIFVDVAVAILVAGAAFLIWLRPKLVLHGEHLVVVNPFRTEVIDYRDIRELDTKWTLRVHHETKSTRIWVAPANGKYRWIAESNSNIFFSKLPKAEGKKVVEISSMSQSRNSDSGVAAALIRERIEGLH